MCKHVDKKFPFLTRYLPDQYKTQQMCDKAILEDDETFKSVLAPIKISKFVIKLLTITLMH